VFFSNLQRAIQSLRSGLTDFHHSDRCLGILGYQLLVEPPQCLTGPLHQRLLGIHHLALRSIFLIPSFLFLFTKLTAYKIYRTMDILSSTRTTPTWNPPEDQPLATSSRIASRQPGRPEYHLLDERLVGARLKVVVNNTDTGKKSEAVVVLIAKVDGVVSILKEVHNSLKNLAPAWVSSTSPNPTRDNGLLMVVKGEHCGKYVRRIHHRYHEDNGNKQALVILAVVKKVDGAADTLTGEQFELGPDSLCLAFETSEAKKLNANLMNSLRENARKRR